MASHKSFKDDIIDILNSTPPLNSDNLYLDENGVHSDNIGMPTHWNWICEGELNGVKYSITLTYKA